MKRKPLLFAFLLIIICCFSGCSNSEITSDSITDSTTVSESETVSEKVSETVSESIPEVDTESSTVSSNEETVPDSSLETSKSADTESSSPVSDTSTDSNDDTSSAPIEKNTESNTDINFDVGRISGNRYSNSYLGIACELDSDWAYLSESEIIEYNNISEQKVSASYVEKVRELEAYFDMIAVYGVNKSDSINVTVQKITDYERLINEDKYIDYLKNDSDISNALRIMNFRNIEYTSCNIDFCGEKKKALKITAVVSELIDVYEVVIPVRALDHYGYVTICTWGEDRCDELAKSFCKYE